MIDHVSVGVSDLERARRFYGRVLATLGYKQLRDWPGAAAGFGKDYPEFWVNLSADMKPPDSAVHICLRAPSVDVVDAFHAAALEAGGVSDGAPGMRPQYNARYYAAFVRDPDGNKLEAVTFIDGGR
jgi:catechol 2,3-dioxygenase-like lactoylglutathione lyase family enzyme